MPSADYLQSSAAVEPIAAGGSPAPREGVMKALARFAWLPFPVLLAAMLVLWAADLTASYVAPPALLFVLQLTFMTLASGVIAYLAFRSFLARGSVGLLLLGCGALSWGLSGVVANAVSHGAINVSVTIHNLCVWISALCHLSGVVIANRSTRAARERGWWLLCGCVLTAAAIGLVAIGATQGWTPTFFVQGHGGTMERQIVLGSAVAMFGVSGLVLLTSDRRAHSPFTNWYGLGLLLAAAGLFGVLIQTVHGSALGWVGMASQWLGGLYLVAAAVAGAREFRASEISLAVAPRDVRVRYCLAAALVMGSSALGLIFMHVQNDRNAYLILYPAVILAALYGGRGPGLLAAALAAVAVNVLWIEPVGHFSLAQASDWVGIALFLGVSAGIVFIIEAMQGASVRASAAEAELRFAAERQQADRALRQSEERAMQAMLEADRRKDVFLATLAHELRNPLAPIRNAAHIMRVGGRNEAELQWARDMIDRQVRQMARLLDDLLDVNRIGRNKLEMKKELSTLAAVVDSALETSRPVIGDGGHELTVSLPAEPLWLYADPVRLAQVFSNLLNNAARYTDVGGRIRLTAERDGGAVAVSVTDNGIGISPELLPGIFDMYSQVTAALERSHGGLGIGLALARGLVDAHGGTIVARSDGPGKGSTFTVRLPLAETADTAPAPAPARTAARSTTGRRLLVADDMKESALTLAAVLRGMGHEVCTAFDGDEAVAEAARFRPDAALLDIRMPRLDGYDACRRIREAPWGKDIVLIALTGWGQDKDRALSAEAGFHHHLVKPVDPLEVASLLERLKR